MTTTVIHLLRILYGHIEEPHNLSSLRWQKKFSELLRKKRYSYPNYLKDHMLIAHWINHMFRHKGATNNPNMLIINRSQTLGSKKSSSMKKRKSKSMHLQITHMISYRSFLSVKRWLYQKQRSNSRPPRSQSSILKISS